MTAAGARTGIGGGLAKDLQKLKSVQDHWSPFPDGAWKVQLAAVPEKGKANEELIRFLADEFGVRRAQVEIVAGQTNAHKQVRVTR